MSRLISLLKTYLPAPLRWALLVGAIIVAVLMALAWNEVLRARQRQFEYRAAVAKDTVTLNVTASEAAIRSIVTLFYSVNDVDGDMFRIYANDLLARDPYIRAALYMPRVSDRHGFEREMQEDGWPDFHIFDRDRQGQAIKAPTRPAYYAVQFIEPFSVDAAALVGYDMLSNTDCLPAIRQATDSGEAVASPMATGRDGRKYYYLFQAVYAGKELPGSVAERRRGANGLIALKIDAGKLLSGAYTPRDMQVRLAMQPLARAGTASSGSQPALLSGPVQANSGGGLKALHIFRINSRIRTPQQVYFLDIQRPVRYVDMLDWLLLAAAVVGSALAAAIYYLVKNALLREQELELRHHEIARQVAQQTLVLRQQAAELFSEKERAQVTLDSIGDAVITTNAKGHVEHLNPVAEYLTGWSNAEAHNELITHVLDISPQDPDATHGLPGLITYLDGRGGGTAHNQLVRRDGRIFAIEVTSSPIRDSRGSVVGSVLVFHDETEQRNLAQQLTWQASHDALTGLPNRRAFEDRAQALLERARTQGRRHVLCYLDLDQFKIVNDTCGHSAGDELLCQISALLRPRIRNSDTLARLGGDEFGILLENCDVPKAQQIAEDLLHTLEAFRFARDHKTFSISASIGIVAIDAHVESLSSILSAADTACYAAKDKGRNQALVYEAEDAELSQRQGEMQWVTRIHQALEENRFRLYHQVIVPIRPQAEAMEHYEILLRLQDEEGNLVPPMAFIPAAERYNLMPLIDRWVIRAALQALQQHPGRAALGRLVCAINLSGQTLCDSSFQTFIEEQFTQTGVPPGCICFEITETAAIANLSRAMSLIHQLKGMGCRFALDDFGSGLSSFGYLQNLPIDYLKIDGSFIKDIETDRTDAAMVEAINQIGHVMGIKTIAEFVENAAIFEKLREIGVDYAQGYGVGKPIPLDLAPLETTLPA